MTGAMPTEQLEVSQRAREYASGILISREAEQKALDGKIDHSPVVQAFARFEAEIRSTRVDRDAADAILADLRGRKLLKYLFDENPDHCGAYGYVDQPIDLETQREIALGLATAALPNPVSDTRDLGIQEEREAAEKRATEMLRDLIGPNYSDTTHRVATDHLLSFARTSTTIERDTVDGLTDDEAWQDLVEKDDRTSPEEYPEMALITREELADYMRAALSPASTDIGALREALEPFALISTEGVVKAETGHVTITTCAEYFHRAAQALSATPAKGV